MFGKPQWFREKKLGWGLTPVTWQGWVYALVWAAVLVVPFLILIFLPIDGHAGRMWEAGVWLIVSIGAMILDVKGILKAIRKSEDDANLLYIGDENAESHVTTRNYDLHIGD